MNEKEIEKMLAGQATREPSGGLEQRMNALFEEASANPRRAPGWRRPLRIPIWQGALASLAFAVAGFFAGVRTQVADVSPADPGSRIYVFHTSPANPIGIYEVAAEPEGFLMSPDSIEVMIDDQS